ncbi:MAG: nickel pincer cofactor biosynthesis protein LarC [Desulfobacteraceae bacterium]
MKTAFLQCFSGISGDMLIGALIDAGLDLRLLEDVVRSLGLPGVGIEAWPEERNEIYGTRFLVHTEESPGSHRGLEEIRGIIEGAGLDQEVRERSLEVFQALAEAEGKIHGLPPGEVHFHEVGAADSIVDIVGGVFGLKELGITRLFCSPLPLGSGFVNSRHGALPVPAPAALELLKGAPVYDPGIREELVTPTGAAMVKVLARGFGDMPALTMESAGYGVGSRRLADRPNLLRIVLGSEPVEALTDTVVMMETDLDDCPPEWAGYVMERLLAEGALDVSMVPVQMKKNRPGVTIRVLGRPDQRDSLAEVLFRESTTLGVRYQVVNRLTLKRSGGRLDSPWGPINVKRVTGPDGRMRCTPEYEECRRIALEKGIPLQDVYAWVNSNPPVPE